MEMHLARKLYPGSSSVWNRRCFGVNGLRCTGTLADILDDALLPKLISSLGRESQSFQPKATEGLCSA
eukprot:7382790-Prymnesium_polylepis.2